MAAQDQVLNDRYQLLEQRAAGGMAIVYRARDLSLSRIVAVKILRPSLTNDPTFLVRFRQEARNVANLSHPNIVTVYDFGQDGSTYYIVMEYVDGQDLKKIIKAEAPLPVDRVLNLGIQICAGVGYAHRANVVHADVKPQNVLVTADDHVKVTDFGIAQVISETQPREKQSIVWGSPHYFAPEQASGDPSSPASDVYAIGIVLFEMLTGRLPYIGVDQQSLALAHMRDPIPHVADFNPRVPVHLDRIIYKVMAKNPNDRYATADQLGRVLIGYKQQGSEQTINQPQQPPAGRSAAPPIAAPVQPQGYQQPNQPQQQPQPYQSPVPYQPPPAPRSPGSSSTLPAQPAAPTAYAVPQQGYQYNNPNNPQYANQYAAPQQPASYPPPGYQQGYVPAPGAAYQPPPGPAAGQFEPTYPLAPPPPVFDLVTIALGLIALLAALGLIPLWLAVVSAYSRYTKKHKLSTSNTKNTAQKIKKTPR